MPIRKNNEINVKIVDTPGSPQKRNAFLPQLSGKNGAVVVYDITNLESYYNARNWIKLVQSKSGKDIIISLVGTKLDLVENNNSDNREVGREVAEQFCQQQGIQFNETSSTNTTSKIAFERLVKKVVHVHRDGKPIQTTNSILITGDDEVGPGGMTGEKSIEDSREYFIKERNRLNQDKEAIERSTGTSFN